MAINWLREPFAEKEDFNNDKVDAGEVGAGHSVTALYEIVPVGAGLPQQTADANPFVKNEAGNAVFSPEATDERLCRLRLRYKQPDGDTSRLIEKDVIGTITESTDQWPQVMAGFGMLLRDSVYRGDLNWDGLITLAKQQRGSDENGDRAEAIRLMEIARDL